MVGISDTDIRRRISRDVRDYVVIDLVVIGIQTDIYIDIGIEPFKICYRLIIDIRLIDVCMNSLEVSKYSGTINSLRLTLP